MKTERSSLIGFCFGVRRAVTMAEETPGSFIVGGDVVHNPGEVERLRKDFNITPAPDIDSIPAGATAVIRAHGISQQAEDGLCRRGITLKDATCHNVKRVHGLALTLSADGYSLFLLGEKSHPEALGIVGRATGTDVTVFSSVKELADIAIPPRVALLSQTTKTLTDFNAAVEFLSTRANEFKSVCTICPAMQKYQQAAADLAKRCDVMVVIGGTKSSNTKALLQTISQFCNDCYSVESAAQLQPEWFAGKQLCGIAAGLSTPDYSINAVESAISAISA